MIQRMFVTLDTKKTNYKNVGKINHGDDLILELTVLTDGDMISFNDPMVDLLVKKSDGKMIRQNSGIEHIKPNKFIIEVGKDCVTSPGLSTNQLIINDNGRISTCMFYYTILNSLEEDIIESISNVEVLEQLDEFTIQIKDKMENFDEELQNRMSELEDAIDDLVEFFGDTSVDLLEAELSRNEAEQSRAQAESVRVQNESRRIQNDLDLANAEAERVRAENIRIQNEADRALVDAVMDQKESKREDLELERIQNESKRATDELVRQQNESVRQSNESIRMSNEIDRKTQENRRVSAETNRVNAETTRRNNENSRISNESERQKAMNEMKSLLEDARGFDERVGVIEDEIEEINSSLDNNANYNVGSVNILNYSIFKIDDCWDEALDEAFKSNKRIYFPNGEYRFKKGCKNLENGNLIYGDGVNHTKLIFNCNDSYLMKFNKNGGFKDICITTENDYNGDVLLLDSPSINENNGRHYTLENVNIYLGFKSGLGTGLKIQIRNNDGLNVYPADNKNSLVYFYVKNFEVYSGNKCIEIYGNQKGEVHNQIWMTASTFSHIRMNSCMYGLYINIENTSNKNVLDFNSLKFNDIEIQTAPKGWFTSDVTKGTTPIYVKGLPSPEWKVNISFNELTIWDSEDGVSGILENANVKITNFLATYTLKDSNHKQGFKCINSHVNIDEDITRVRTTGASGRLSEINYVDGGFQFINCPDTNGWSAKGKLYQELTNGSNSQVVLESYNKNNSKTSYLNLGDQIEMYGNTFTGVNIKATDHAGTLRDVLTRGYKNTLYNTSQSEQGFFSGNGMWIGEQRTTLDIPPSEIYQEIQVPITETFTFTPFLLGYTIHYAEPYNDTNEDVFVRIAQVIDKTKIRFRVKHSKSTNINVRVSFVLCGYKEI